MDRLFAMVVGTCLGLFSIAFWGTLVYFVLDQWGVL